MRPRKLGALRAPLALGATLPVSLASLAILGCVDLGRTTDTVGSITLSVDARSSGTSLSKETVRGGIRFRRLSETTTIMAARVLRSDSGVTRRGDLFFRIVTPYPVKAGGNFAGDFDLAGAGYTEADSSGASDTFAVSGRVRANLGFTDPPVLRVALEMRLEGKMGGAPRTLIVRGIGTSSTAGAVSSSFGNGLFLEPFDLTSALVDVALDLDTYASSAAGGWLANAATDAPAGYGHFTFGEGGEVSSPDYTGSSSGESPGSSSSGDVTTSSSASNFDDDADGGCQGDKANQDTSQCASARGARGLGALFVVAVLWASKRRRQRQRQA